MQKPDIRISLQPLGESKTTDKMIVLLGMLHTLPPEAFNELKKVTLNWQEIDRVAVPVIEILYQP